MANTFFEPGNQRSAKVNDLFDRIAPRYDLLNDLQSFGLHRCWKRRVVQLARVQPGALALDVCCGTGDIALALARRGAEVTGLDFNEQMLAVAEIRKARVQIEQSAARGQQPAGTTPAAGTHIKAGSPSGCGNPHFVRGDAQCLPFEDESFEIATIGYGLRNLADLEAGLREMRRVLKPGGRLVALDFGKPDNAIWRTLYFGYLKLFVPLLGRLFCRNATAYAYILESLKHYPGQQSVAAKLRELGLANVRIVNLLGGVMSIHYAEKPR